MVPKRCGLFNRRRDTVLSYARGFDESGQEKEDEMAVADKLSAREAKRLQTRERLMGAAIAEFKRTGMAEADVGAIVAAAGVAHGTFFFHFPTKEHVLLALERREEDRIAKQFAQFLKSEHDLASALLEAVRLVMGLERRLGDMLFKDFLSAHFSQTRPPAEDGRDHPLIVLVAQEIAHARERGDTDPGVTPMNSAVFFLLGLYALLIATHDWPTRDALVEDYVARTLRSMGR
jgi:AcrR family transcriptional regulator